MIYCAGIYLFVSFFLCVALWLSEPYWSARLVFTSAFSWPWILGSELYEKFKWRLSFYKQANKPKRPVERKPSQSELN